MLERIGSFKLIFPPESRFVEFPRSKVIADDEDEEGEIEAEEEEDDTLSNVEEAEKEVRGKGFEGGVAEGLSEEEMEEELYGVGYEEGEA